MNTRTRSKFTSTKNAALAGALLAITLGAPAATTDLAPAPLVTTPTASVLPNVFLMLDDSGSMGWDYMPDTANDFGSGKYGAASSQCNGVAYNPNIRYIAPVDSTGSYFADSSFTAAWKDGYNTGTGTTNLSTSFISPGGDSAQAAFYYKYTGLQDTEAEKNYYSTSSVFYKECNSTVGTTTKHDGVNAVNTIFTKVVVSSTSGPGTLDINGDGAINATDKDERTNFANWYSYYRIRMLTMKTATGHAFKTIGDSFRVGYGSLNNNTSSDFLNLKKFDATQKADFYTKLYAASTGSSTPLREALAKVGRMYAGKVTTFNGVAVVDPIEYSCQQNFTLLTTDGFWNGNAGYKVDGSTAVANQDGTEPRPMYDGANVSSQAVTTTDTVVRKQSVQDTSANTIWTRDNITSVSAVKDCGGGGGYDTSGTSCLADNAQNSRSRVRTWCLGNADNGVNNEADCSASLGTTSGSIRVKACRGISNTTNKPDYVASGIGTGCETDAGGVTRCLYYNSNHSGGSTIPAGATSCTAVYSGNDVSYCIAPPLSATPTGYTVVTQPQTYTQTVIGTTTTVTDYPSTLTKTVVTTNGVSTTTNTTTNGTPVVISSNTASTSDTGVPDGSTTWVNSGGSVTSCQATPPALGATTAAAGTPTSTPQGAATVTTLSTTSTVNPTVTTSSATGGTSDTLADVAEYYYITDLRTVALGNNISGAAGAVNGSDISNNNVPSSGADSASHQHMTTFTLGLGARGKMVFDPSYQTATSGDFFSVKQGSTATTGVCSWQASGACNWPIPGSDKPENIDDLWHAAVNGRGTYFSAANPSDLAIGLTTALGGVSARLGSSAAATTSTAFITQGDNFLFRSSFVSLQWTGELVRQQLDVNTGAVLPAVDWSAQTKLDAQISRSIYFYDAGTSSKLSAFLWGNLNATQQGYFNLTNIQTLTQSCASGATCLSAADQTAAAGSNLVNYIRGDRTNEGALADNTKYYRQRLHLLGDIVDSESVYIKNAMAAFTDPGYSTFTASAAITGRKAMVYVGANDGMLHAFRASDDAATSGVDEGGQEDWAYIPSMVMPNLYKLADKGYSLKHQFYVDGTPVPADICVSSCTTSGAVWKTILVGGLNNGGRGYFAMDVTDPANPKALWEFVDVNMGYSYGNPKIVKLKDGTWVAVVSSGYNNVPPDAPSGDGMGHLYVLNAYTGALITDISTGVGTTATPSGLSRIDVPVASPGIDATALAAYGGDLHGNLWRFDINGPDTQSPNRWADIGSTGFDAQLLATLRDGAGNEQPITSKPLITLVGTTLVVNVGTGRYLGSTDQADTSQQSFYAIKDTFPTGTTPSVAIYGNPRTEGTFIQQTQSSTSCPAGTPAAICSAGQSVVVSNSTNAVNFASDSGWFFDFPHSGERNNTDAAINKGTLLLTTNIPNSSSCSVGGDSYLYQLDYRTGGAVTSSTTDVTATKLGNELASRPVVACLSDGTCEAYVQGSGGTTPTNTTVWENDNSDGVARRVSWRELLVQ